MDDDVDEVEADETVFAGSEDAMLDSRSGDMADSAKKRKIGIINAFKSFKAFYSFAHWHAQSSQPTGLQTCDNHINLGLNKFFWWKNLGYGRFSYFMIDFLASDALLPEWKPL